MARLIISLLLSLLISNELHSQVVLHAPSLVQESNDEFFIEVSVVSGFDTLSSLSFALKWNPDVIKFLDLESTNLPPAFTEPFFNFQNLEDGLLPFLWLHASSSGSLEDGTVLMRFKFKAVGASGAMTLFEFVETDNTEIGANAGSTVVPVVTDTGKVELAPLFVNEISEISFFSITPNPSSEDILANFSIAEPLDLTWSVFDLAGKELKKDRLNTAFGSQTITINRDVFPTQGSYIFSVRSSKGVLTKNIIIQ